MPTRIPLTTDPLRALLGSAAPGGARHPIPLVSTALEVEIDGGVAIVSTHRVFRNVEAESIEATLTFPVPVHATLFSLEARIGDRLLHARAQRRVAARETYEAALEDGNVAVLHEEVLRGIHMLSAGPIAPGAEVEVVARWVATLTNIGSQGEIRVPLTVGEIYGKSPLPDSDAFHTFGSGGTAELVVRCGGGTVALLGGDLADGRANVPLDAPVDLVVSEAETRDLHGLAADGREVVLRVSPCIASEGPLDVALLVDHSGSMNSAASVVFATGSKHQAVVAGLAAIEPALRAQDAIDLWEFNNDLSHVGRTDRSGAADPGQPGSFGLSGLVARLQDPCGGTEIGQAVEGAIHGSEARDLLVITDGKSYSLDVHAIARRGRRISAVLIGEDSLEANVGHLAALTGGDIFVAIDADIAGVLATALSTLRAPVEPAEPDPRNRLRAVRRNAVIDARWRDSKSPRPADLWSRAVGALAASLCLARLPEDEAAGLAEAEGLVTHLTSLILVDTAGPVQEGIPATRKIPLPEPRRHNLASKSLRKLKHPGRVRHLRMFVGEVQSVDHEMLRADNLNSRSFGPLPEVWNVSNPLGVSSWRSLLLSSEALAWEAAPNRLIAGDLSWIESSIATGIRRLSTTAAVLETARRLRLDPLLVVIGMLARHNAQGSRAATRVAKSIFRGADPAALDYLGELLGNPGSTE